jgi:hypothetical protein
LEFAKGQANRIAQLRPELKWPIVWVSCQEFNASELVDFASLLEHQKPTWLAGVVYGPHTSLPISDVRKLIPKQYRMRAYPDLGHGLKCGYPNERWSAAYAFTEAREVVNPRPKHFADVIRRSQGYTIGFSGYSDGCNDDVNKVVWSMLHWKPDEPVSNVMMEYGRYFWGLDSGGSRLVDANAAELLMGLEENWVTSPPSAHGAMETLAMWQRVESAATRRPRLLQDWRLQMHLYRAYYDAYQALRAEWEDQHVDRATLNFLEQYSNSSSGGVDGALSRARAWLSCATTGVGACPIEALDVRPEWLTRLWQYADALYNSVSMELSVERYAAIGLGRAASMDTVHVPLSNVRWLLQRCEALLEPDVSHTERIAGVREILEWRDPGPDGFYDNLGVFGAQPHLLPGVGPAEDPSFYHSVLSSFMEPFNASTVPVWPYSWYTWAETFYGTPLQLKYTGLSRTDRFRVKFVYGNGATGPHVLVRVDAILANGTAVEMQPYKNKPSPPDAVVLSVPDKAISPDGTLILQWKSPGGGGGNGRSCQVSEVWLEKVKR